MSYKILEMNGAENENIDGAAFNNFAASGRDGIIKGVLNECKIFASSDTTIEISTGEFIVQGFRIKIQSPQSYLLTSRVPSQEFYGVIRLELSLDRTLSCEIQFRQDPPSRKDRLFAAESGVYEVQIAKFTLGLTIENLSGFLPVITSDTATAESLGTMAEEALNKAATAEENSSRAMTEASRALELVQETVGGDISLSAYPIGSIYISVNNTSPAELFGGSWSEISGRFLIGSGTVDTNTTGKYGALNGVSETFTLGDKGGQFKHTLTIDEMPKHTHSISRPKWYAADTEDTTNIYGTTSSLIMKVTDNTTSTIKNTGGGSMHNVLNPYLVVNMWKRIA